MTSVSAEHLWIRALDGLPEWQPPRLPVLVVAPHPDDETLGAGGLIATQRRRGVPVRVIAVTDGEAAYSDASGLAELRCAEQEAALAELGVDSADLIRLRLPDGSVSSFEDALPDLVRPFVESGNLLVAPWSLDPHPDHEACGRAAERVARSSPGLTLISYVFWAWHRNSVESLTALPLHRFELDERVQAARAAALSRHRSQLKWDGQEPILPSSLLDPVRRSFETFIIHA